MMNKQHEYIKQLMVDPAKVMEDFAIPNTVEVFAELLETRNDELIKSVVRSVNPFVLNKNAGLTRIFSTTDRTHAVSSKLKVALIMHSYFPDLVPYLLKYAASMPEDADIYLTTGSDEKAQAIQEQFDKSNIKCSKFEVRVIENRGRDVSALLVGGADLVDKYDLFCYAHDKKSSYMLPESVGETWSDLLFECNLASKEFVHNVVDEFAANDHLGLTLAPLVHHADYFFLLGGKHNWVENFKPTTQLLKSLGVHNLPKRSIPLFAPLGSMFWARTDAVRKIFDKGWTYEDFPPEPLPLDASISHAIERVWAYLAADAGYYSLVTIPDDYFSTEFSALAHYLHGILAVCARNNVSFGAPKIMASSIRDLLGGNH
jgi:rhamnosyltransferase